MRRCRCKYWFASTTRFAGNLLRSNGIRALLLRRFALRFLVRAIGLYALRHI